MILKKIARNFPVVFPLLGYLRTVELSSKSYNQHYLAYLPHADGLFSCPK